VGTKRRLESDTGEFRELADGILRHIDPPKPPSVFEIIANRVAQMHVIRDASGDVGFRDAQGQMVRLERWLFQRQLAQALERACGSGYWGEYSAGPVSQEPPK